MCWYMLDSGWSRILDVAHLWLAIGIFLANDNDIIIPILFDFPSSLVQGSKCYKGLYYCIGFTLAEWYILIFTWLYIPE